MKGYQIIATSSKFFYLAKTEIHTGMAKIEVFGRYFHGYAVRSVNDLCYSNFRCYITLIGAYW